LKNGGFYKQKRQWYKRCESIIWPNGMFWLLYKPI
jgi:hypothetical protein